MIKIEITYEGVTFKKEFDDVDDAIEWLKENTEKGY